jgi:Cu(I)/Ag(I) efflux system membrane protein CusA/SilA
MTKLPVGIPDTFLNRMLRFFLEQKLLVFFLLLFITAWGIYVAPFDWEFEGFLRDPVAVDAIPDIGENQQIVFTEWQGRSPQDIEDQITYPLTTALLGIPGVKTIRSFSMFGFSSIYIIFEESFEFYWTRSRILEKLNSLAPNILPSGIKPTLGPDATALGQVFWYTLEGRGEKGQATGGWDPQELRTIQDWTVRYALSSAYGVSEVASIGGYAQEYQIDVDPDAMRAYKVTLQQVFEAIQFSNIDVGARTIEINRVEYLIRGLGFIKEIADIENAVIQVQENVPIYIKNVAKVSKGPAYRLGILDKEGAEAVGGVVVARYGSNPLEVIKNVKKKIAEIAPSLPQKRIQGTLSQVTILPFYDRTQLIYETLGTLRNSIVEEILTCLIVVLAMIFHFRSALLISAVLPLTVLMCFIGMKLFRVDANIVALSGIAIAIGTIVDMGIILCENILTHLEKAPPEEPSLEVIYRATVEVGSAILTALSTTVVTFLPVFAMTGPEGKLFRPLAYTKTFALLSSLVIALFMIPAFAHLLFTFRVQKKSGKFLLSSLLSVLSLFLFLGKWKFLGTVFLLWGLYSFLEPYLSERYKRVKSGFLTGASLVYLSYLLTQHWMPLGVEKGLGKNYLFTGTFIFGLIGFFLIFQKIYPFILSFFLNHKFLFLSFPSFLVLLSLVVWLGFPYLFSFVPESYRANALWKTLYHTFPGLKKEFMPPLDEGSYLLMPVTMPHASTGEVLDLLQKMDKAVYGIPEVEQVVGKAGRVESALDPAPLSMMETIIQYKPEYEIDSEGNRLTFKYDETQQDFVRDEQQALIQDPQGRIYRNWRPQIQSPDDIWEEIVQKAQIPGLTSAPKLQPIATRLVMLQSGIRAPMAVKIKGSDLKTIETVGLQIEKFLKELNKVQTEAVIADRILGGPYLEIHINRQALARYGISIDRIQNTIEVAIGGIQITNTVEGRQRFAVRVRYQRELRDSIQSLEKILIPNGEGLQIPLSQLAEIRYHQGPKMIRSEDTFLTGYVLFDKKLEYGEVETVEEAIAYLKYQESVFQKALNFAIQKAHQENRKLSEPEIQTLPGLRLNGCSYAFTGNYENQVHSEKTLRILLPFSFFLMFLLLYLEFQSLLSTLIIFCGISTAWCGGFLMVWLYGQDWFLKGVVGDVSLRELFQIHPIHMSVAVWVGFLALFGISEDDEVVMTTYLNQSFEGKVFHDLGELRACVVSAGQRRIRPCLMTAGTTIIALIPVLTSSGRGSDVMVPMAIPSFGGMFIGLLSIFVVPVLYCLKEEIRWKWKHTPSSPIST